MKKFLPLLTILLLSASLTAKKSHDMALQRNLKTFNSMVKTLEQNYVDSIRIDEAFKAASRAMLNTIDPYTEYYSPEDRDELLKMTTGEYAGIGSYIVQMGDYVCISAPMEGSPAAKAGLMPGDKIVKVDSVEAKGLKNADVSKLLKGTPGTVVNIEVVRPYVEDSLKSFSVTREKVGEKSVPWYGMISPQTGYVRLTAFIYNTPKEFSNALDSLKSNPDFKSLILDLRGNGGGLVESAVEVLGNFLPKGTEVLRTKAKTGSDRVYKTTHKPSLPDMPIVVLVDGGTASASEITAGALQDLDRAVLVGSQTFGKGLVQSTFPLPHDALLKVTVAKYYIPSGRLIQALDYSRRNPDGSVARTPDSLTNVFHTLRGREVRDGGGLQPDSPVEIKNYSDILYNLVAKNKIFDYATRYRAAHPDSPQIPGMEISDSTFSDFIEYVAASDMHYDSSFDELIKEMRKQASDQGYATVQTDSVLNDLQSLLGSNLRRDMEFKRKEISEYLIEEIASRYLGDRGRIMMEVVRDPVIAKGVEILSGPDYQAALSGKETQTKSGKK